MVINLTDSGSYSGLGDVVSWSWIAEGVADAAPLTFFRDERTDILRLLNMNYTENRAGVILDEAYRVELRDAGARLRLDYMKEFVGIAAAPKRPRLNLRDDDREFAEKTLARFGPLVLLFPQANYNTRAWPPSYWVELAWLLERAKTPAVVLLDHKDDRFTNVPIFQFGMPLGHVAALMAVSRLVVANDSFPAHLGGTVGVDTFALSGPTRPQCVFGHLPHVTALTADRDEIDCTGCHFKPPFRAACDQGCLSLMRLYPEHVAQAIWGRLGQQEGRIPLL